MSIYEQIREKIIEGVYKPGERLTEEFLANDLNISRTPIREALKTLQSEGLITPLKRGVIVKDYTREDIRQIYDLRILLEGHAAYQAAIYRTDEHISKLLNTNKEYSLLLETFETNKLFMKKIMSTNNLYHDALFSAAKNDYISLLNSMVVIAPLVFQSLYWYDIDRLKRSVKAHDTITTAVINRDADRAKTAMLEHMYDGRDTIFNFIK